MKQNWLFIHFLSFIYILVVLFSYPYRAYGVNISTGSILPQFNLNVPDDSNVKRYLGLKNLKSFSISQISAKLILVEIYSFYCPICHKQAPIANKLFNFIQQDPELSKDIKMIGIGAGNNQREIDVYKSNFRVPFPLFSDVDFKIHKKIGEPRTPTTILVTNKGKVLLAHTGVMEDMDEFVRKIKDIYAKQ